jgi:hypothetical protein
MGRCGPDAFLCAENFCGTKRTYCLAALQFPVSQRPKMCRRQTLFWLAYYDYIALGYRGFVASTEISSLGLF